MGLEHKQMFRLQLYPFDLFSMSTRHCLVNNDDHWSN